VQKGLLSISTEDIPHKAKSSAMLLISMHKTHNLDLTKIKLAYTGDEFKMEDIHWFYRDTAEQMEKISEAEGVKDAIAPIAAALTAQAKNWKDNLKK
jgi:hypothetical protein